MKNARKLLTRISIIGALNYGCANKSQAFRVESLKRDFQVKTASIVIQNENGNETLSIMDQEYIDQIREENKELTAKTMDLYLEKMLNIPDYFFRIQDDLYTRVEYSGEKYNQDMNKAHLLVKNIMQTHDDMILSIVKDRLKKIPYCEETLKLINRYESEIIEFDRYDQKYPRSELIGYMKTFVYNYEVKLFAQVMKNNMRIGDGYLYYYNGYFNNISRLIAKNGIGKIDDKGLEFIKIFRSEFTKLFYHQLDNEIPQEWKDRFREALAFLDNSK